MSKLIWDYINNNKPSNDHFQQIQNMVNRICATCVQKFIIQTNGLNDIFENLQYNSNITKQILL